MPRLVTLLINERLALPGLRLNSLTVDVEKQLHTAGWRVVLRGPRMFFVSPKDLYYEVTRSVVHPCWEGVTDETCESATQKWASPTRDEMAKAKAEREKAAGPLPGAVADPTEPDEDDGDEYAPLPVKQGGKR